MGHAVNENPTTGTHTMQNYISIMTCETDSELAEFAKHYDYSIYTKYSQRSHLYNVISTSMQRHDVASTLRRRCIDVMCLLGLNILTPYHTCPKWILQEFFNETIVLSLDVSKY